jgi:mannose-6-phosphate isomerase
MGPIGPISLIPTWDPELMPLYPLRFEPIFKSMLWGGRRLPAFLNREPPHSDPVGEAWVLSDVDGSPSVVADGPLAGTTLRELLARDPARLIGRARAPSGKFPLLLKFIDARQELSVQVHPNDEQAARVGPGQFGKTEAWVVLERCAETSRIYAGFAEGVTADHFRAALTEKTTPRTLHSYTPEPGDCIFLEAGTVHAIGANILLFEVQQTSDITYRLYDWDRVDAKTGQPRQLHVDEGLACADFRRGPCRPVVPIGEDHPRVKRERLVSCGYFTLHRMTGTKVFNVGAPGECRIVVALKADARSEIEWDGDVTGLSTGDVLLIPAEVGECTILPAGEIVLLECRLPR